MALPRVLSRDELRELDRVAVEELGLPSILLMENAAIGASRSVLRALGVLESGVVVVVAGTGNNGGDGLAVARQLHIQGVEVRVALIGDAGRMTADSAANLKALRAASAAVEVIGENSCNGAEERVAAWLGEIGPAVVIDALLGTGLSRDVEGPVAGAIRAINRARSERSTLLVVSLDLPSGLDADTGRPLGEAVRADVTATFAALKRGFFTMEAQEWVGEIELLPIGVPPELTARFGEPFTAEPTEHARGEDWVQGGPPENPHGAGRDAGEGPGPAWR